MPVCQRCGYKWEYEGYNKFAYCYKCNNQLSNDLKKKEIKILEEFLEEIHNNPEKFIEAFKKEISDK